jgi:general secretion pathway protein D
MNNNKINKAVLYILTLIILATASCTSTKPEKTDENSEDRLKKEEPADKNITENKDKDIEDKDSIYRQAVKPVKIPKKASISKEDIQSVQQEEIKEVSNTSQKPFYDYFLKKEKVSGELNRVTIAFDAAPIADVVPIFAKILKFNYLIDPTVSGVVTMSINSELTQKDLWQLFQQILWLTGSYCSLDGELVHILPFDQMAKERQLLSTHPPQANVSVVFFPVKNAKSTEILEKIKPFLTEGAIAMDITSQNAILVVEAPTNMPKIRTLVRELDIKNKFKWPQAIIRCVNIPATKAVEELCSILPVLGFPVSVDSTSDEPGAIELQAIDRLQLIIASAANKQALAELKKWVNILDRTDVGEQEQVYVYNIINAKAEELVKALSIIFTVEGETLKASKSSSSSGSSSDSSLGGSLGGSSENMMVSAFNSTKASSKQSGKSAETQKTPVSVFDVPVKIFADAINNRLIFRTTPRTFAMIKALLNRIDTVPSQVLLQIIIAEIKLSSSTNFGLEFEQEMGGGGVTNTIGTNYPSLKPATGTDAGFQYTLSGGNSKVYIRALAEKGNTKILARPQILVESHTEAKVSVGDEIPLLTNDLTNTESVTEKSTTVQRNYEYKNTGIILNITPHVTKGGLITVDLDQTISTPVYTAETLKTDTPTIRTRQMVTTLSFPDKTTLIIGGLIQNRYKGSQATLPLIGNIPILAEIIGSNDISKERTELLLMITGTIVSRNTKLEEMIEDYRRATEYMEEMEQEDNVFDNIILQDENINNILIK